MLYGITKGRKVIAFVRYEGLRIFVLCAFGICACAGGLVSLGFPVVGVF